MIKKLDKVVEAMQMERNTVNKCDQEFPEIELWLMKLKKIT